MTRAKRPQAAPANDTINLITLRPLQETATEKVRGELRFGRKAVLLVAPTGFGKTAVASELIRRCVNNGKRVLFLVHRREIVRDTARRLRAVGVACAVVMANEPPPDGEMVLVCSVQTLAARGDRPPGDVLFWDEAHHCAARTYRAIASAYPNAVHLGLTATPERSDGTGLGDMFESLVVGAQTHQLIAEGLLTPCDVIAPPELLDGLAWEPLEAWQKHAPGKRTVVFAANVAHAETLAAQFNAAGVVAACVHGNTPTRERDRILEDFAAGRITVVCNVYCLTEGWDCPPTEVCLLARGCSAPGMFLQMVGRVLRTAPGKSRALLIDLKGVVHVHGLPEDERQFSLEGDPIKTDKALALRTCQACGATFRPKPVCPRCGYVFPPPPPPAIVRATLKTIGSASLASRADKLTEWDRLRIQVQRRGYKPGWAAHQFKERFGHWPPRDFPRCEGAS